MKLEPYGVTDRNHSGFNYLSNRKQLIQTDNEKNTQLERITCAVPQGSVLGLLLLLLCVNDLKNASNLLDSSVVFADDTNLLLIQTLPSLIKLADLIA